MIANRGYTEDSTVTPTDSTGTQSSTASTMTSAIRRMGVSARQAGKALTLITQVFGDYDRKRRYEAYRKVFKHYPRIAHHVYMLATDADISRILRGSMAVVKRIMKGLQVESNQCARYRDVQVGLASVLYLGPMCTKDRLLIHFRGHMPRWPP